MTDVMLPFTKPYITIGVPVNGSHLGCHIELQLKPCYEKFLLFGSVQLQTEQAGKLNFRIYKLEDLYYIRI